MWFPVKEYTNRLPRDMQEGLKSLAIGDLIYDPYYGYGVVLKKHDTNFENWEIIFHSDLKTFYLDEDQVYFLKRNIYILIEAEDKEKKGLDKKTIKEYWRDLYCIF
jgi:hypothetical protein